MQSFWSMNAGGHHSSKRCPVVNNRQTELWARRIRPGKEASALTCFIALDDRSLVLVKHLFLGRVCRGDGCMYIFELVLKVFSCSFNQPLRLPRASLVMS